jgi:hypothetical protein
MGEKGGWTYNVYVDSFSPAVLSGVVFLTEESMVSEDKGANFGPEMTALAKSFKARFGGDDVPFIYTVPAKALAPKVIKPEGIKGKSTAVEITDWQRLDEVLKALE